LRDLKPVFACLQTLVCFSGEQEDGVPFGIAVWPYVLWFSVIMFVKEIIEMIATKTLSLYWKQYENIGQVILILFTIVLNTCSPSCKWGYMMSVVSLHFNNVQCTVCGKFCASLCIIFCSKQTLVLIAGLLVLGQLNKHPRLGINMEMYMKVIDIIRTAYFIKISQNLMTEI